MTTFFQEYMPLLFCILGASVILLFVFCIVLLLKINREKKRYDLFTGSKRRPPHNLETKIQEYYEHSKSIDEKYTKILDMMTDIDKTSKQQIRKVGLVRYNPFEEMGGNLCFALALLDGEDNGVVLNGIHSRTGSFTYAKPIEMGVSTYMLSDEEKQAVKMAQDNAYEPQHEKIVKVKFKPIFKRRYAAAMEQQMLLKDVVAKQKMASLGDVTMAEKAQIHEEEKEAGKIAAADLENLQKDLQTELQMELHTEDLETTHSEMEEPEEETKIQPKRSRLWRSKQKKNNTDDIAVVSTSKEHNKTLQEKVQEELQKAEMENNSENPVKASTHKEHNKTLQEKVQEELQKAEMENNSETTPAKTSTRKEHNKTFQEKVQEELQKAEMETPALNKSEKAWKNHVLEELEKAKAEKASMEIKSSTPPKSERNWKEKIMEELEKAELEKFDLQKNSKENEITTSAEALQKDLQAELQSLLSDTEDKG